MSLDITKCPLGGKSHPWLRTTAMKCETCSTESDSRSEGVESVSTLRQRMRRNYLGKEEAGGNKGKEHSQAEGATLQRPGGKRD